MLKKYFLIIITLLHFTTHSQNAKIDSLKIEIKKNKEDKFLDYLHLANAYTNIGNSYDSIEKYTLLGKEIAIKQNNDKYISKAYIGEANLYYLKRDFDKAIIFANKSLTHAKKGKDYTNLATGYNFLGKIAYFQNKPNDCIHNGELAIVNFAKIIDKKPEAAPLKLLCHYYISISYNNIGNYTKAIKHKIEIKKLISKYKIQNKETTYYSLEATINGNFKKYDEAIKSGMLRLKYAKLGSNKVAKIGNLCEGYYDIAEFYNKKNNILLSRKYLDSSKLYLDDYVGKNTIESYYKTLEADLLLKENRVTKKSIDSILNFVNKKDNVNLSLSHLLKGKFYMNNHNYDKSIESYLKAKEIYTKNNLNQRKADAVLELIKLYSLKNDSVNTIKSLNEYNQITDKIFNEQVAKSITATEIKYETELKESKIKTQQLQIQKEKTNKNIALSSIGLILLLGLGGFWFYRSKQNQTNLKTQNTLLGLQQNLIEAELSNLNKQLDPHEIKNLLAHISPEIQEKAPESYRKMLKLFNLTKASLNSSSITDTIENQLMQIDDFLSLEKSMSAIPLEYSIQNSIENTQTEIPRLLLKNLVENAIKHGIKQQETGGNISVTVQEKDNFIYIAVDDTGKGRQYAISLDSGIGTTTYQKLFATLNPKNKENATFEIIDKEQGTKVEVKIPTHYKYS